MSPQNHFGVQLLPNRRGIPPSESLEVILWLESAAGEAWSGKHHLIHFGDGNSHRGAQVASVKEDVACEGSDDHCYHAGLTYWSDAWRPRTPMGKYCTTARKWSFGPGPECLDGLAPMTALQEAQVRNILGSDASCE